MKNSPAGFTLIELMVVVAVIAILATIAMPSIQDRLVRQQIVEAMALADVAKAPVAASWSLTHTLPVDNAAAGLPAADKIVSNLVKSVVVESGAIHVTFGNRANAAIFGKTLTLRPAVVEDTPIVPVSWLCGHASAVEKMTAKGEDRTNVQLSFLPLNCRASP
jgi:type IV pilus assembly protein PilA